MHLVHLLLGGQHIDGHLQHTQKIMGDVDKLTTYKMLLRIWLKSNMCFVCILGRLDVNFQPNQKESIKSKRKNVRMLFFSSLSKFVNRAAQIKLKVFFAESQ